LSKSVQSKSEQRIWRPESLSGGLQNYLLKMSGIKCCMARIGFTLAEILIVLGIIGVVAELTIPTLMNNVQDKVFRTAWKETFSQVSQVYTSMVAENGSIEGALSGVTDDIGFKNVIKQYFAVVNDCDTTWNCFESSVKTAINTDPSYWVPHQASIVLKNGVAMSFGFYSADCSSDGFAPGACGRAVVDVNGQSKGPNKWASDIYAWIITKNGVVAEGAIGTFPATYNTCSPTLEGYSCSFDYLYK